MKSIKLSDRKVLILKINQSLLLIFFLLAAGSNGLSQAQQTWKNSKVPLDSFQKESPVEIAPLFGRELVDSLASFKDQKVSLAFRVKNRSAERIGIRKASDPSIGVGYVPNMVLCTDKDGEMVWYFPDKPSPPTLFSGGMEFTILQPGESLTAKMNVPANVLLAGVSKRLAVGLICYESKANSFGVSSTFILKDLK